VERLSQVAIIFGRFNPPHKGHKVAWKRAATIPHWFVGTNESTVGPTDPLPFNIKEKAMLAIYPELKGHLITQQSWFTMASAIFERYGDVELICVTDEAWVVPGLQKANGREYRHGYYKFSNIRLFHKDVGAAKADMRKGKASDLRAAALAGDREAFTNAAGISAETMVAGHPYFDLVVHYLKPYGAKAEKANAKKLATAEPVNTVEPQEPVMKQGPAKTEVAESMHRRDAYQRDEYSAHQGFGRAHKEWDEGNTEPPNNFAIHINGKKWKVLPGHGTYADDHREQKQHRQLQDMCAKKTASTGKKWTVHPTGEQATVESVAESKTVKAEAPKPRNFVAKNAINTGAGAHKDKKKAAKQGDVKHKKQLEFAEGRLGFSLNSMFEEKFRAKLKEAVLRADTASSMPNLRIHPDLDNSSPYKAYRYGVAMASQPRGPADEKGPFGQKMITIGYTEADNEIIRATDKKMHSKSQAMSDGKSKELDDTHTISPIAKPKRNQYGV
jgi:hypothetical protein